MHPGLSTGKGEKWPHSERRVMVFTLSLPPLPMMLEAEPQYLESKGRAALVGAGVRVEGQTPDPLSAHCSLLPSPHPIPPMVLTPSTMV